MKLKKIKVIPHQGKRVLNKDILSTGAPWQWKTVIFFGVLFGKGDFTSST